MISRVKHKEEARHTMETQQNKSGMIGVNILGTVLNAAVTSLISVPFVFVLLIVASAFTILFGLIFGIGAIGLIQDLSVASILGTKYLSSYLVNAGSVISNIVGILLVVAACFLYSIIREAICGPVITGQNRFYLYIKKNGLRPSAMSVFEGFDHYLNLAAIYAIKTFHILLWPCVCYFAGKVLCKIIFWISISAFSFGGIVFGRIVDGIVFIIVLILWIYRSLEMWAVPWIIADHPQYTADQVMKLSKQICKGHIWDLFVLWLSFLGWDILSVITGGLVGLLFVNPYKNMTYALTYAELVRQPIALDGIIVKMHPGSTDLTGVNIYLPPPPPPPSVPAMVGVTGMYAGNNFPIDLDKELIIGRDSKMASVVISSGGEKVSRRHCSVRFNSRNNNYEVVDFSSNGVFVEGHRITPNAPVQLPRGTQIELGNKNNTFRLI